MSQIDTKQQALLAREAIRAKMGIDPVILDLRTISTVADYFVLATGRNGPHLKALAEEVSRIETAGGLRKVRTTGVADSGWIVLDFFGVVVHLFEAERRSYYALEALWNQALFVD